MSKINLLPWREEQRELSKKVFLSTLGGFTVAAVIIIFGIDIQITDLINAQNKRNQYLSTNILKLDEKIKTIHDFKKRKDILLGRINIINGLQADRPIIVKVFDQLARIMPKGIHFKSLQIKDKEFSLVGIAESNNRVSALMRNLDFSELFSNPNLTAVRKLNNNGELLNEFDLTFILAAHNKKDSES